jgi:hypothetical protein
MRPPLSALLTDGSALRSHRIEIKIKMIKNPASTNVI